MATSTIAVNETVSSSILSGVVIPSGAVVPSNIILPSPITIAATPAGPTGTVYPAVSALPTRITLPAAITIPSGTSVAIPPGETLTGPLSTLPDPNISPSPTISSNTSPISSSTINSITCTLIAASSSISPPTSTARPCPNHAGAIAGAAVGAGVGAALLAIILTWLICKSLFSRGRITPPPTTHDGARHYAADSKLGNINERAIPSTPPLAMSVGENGLWQQHLPQSADDDTVKTWMKTLFDQIENHVENFYQNNPAHHAINPTEMAVPHLESPYIAGPVKILLSQSSEPIQLIKHCIVWSILSSISPELSIHRSILPDEFTTVPRTHINMDSKTIKQRVTFDRAMSQWRVLTAYLRAQPSSDRNYISKRDRTIQKDVSEISAIFTPWANQKRDSNEKIKNLNSIFISASEKGIKLFSQPSKFQFEWKFLEEARSNDMITVTPSFVKVQDEHAQTLRPPQMLIESTKSRI